MILIYGKTYILDDDIHHPYEYLGIDDDEHYFLHTSKSRFTSGFQIGISFKSEELTNLKIKEVIK